MNLFFVTYCLILIGGLFGGLGYAYFSLPVETWQLLGSEAGLPEKITAIVFALTALLSFITFFKRRDKIWFYFGFLMVAAAMRELDLHKAWTTDSIFKTRFYSGDAAPFYEKVLGLLVVAALIFCLIQFIRHIPLFIFNLKRFHPMALSILFGLGALGSGKMLDSMARLLPFTAEFLKENRPLFTMIEESLEMTASFFFLLTCLLAFLFKSYLQKKTSK